MMRHGGGIFLTTSELLPPKDRAPIQGGQPSGFSRKQESLPHVPQACLKRRIFV